MTQWHRPHAWQGDECARCGMRQHWPGAQASCSGPRLEERDAPGQRIVKGKPLADYLRDWRGEKRTDPAWVERERARWRESHAQKSTPEHDRPLRRVQDMKKPRAAGTAGACDRNEETSR